MKKTLKSVLLLIVMAIMVFALTGCGNKIVGTKTEEDSIMGKYTEKIEVKLKGKKVTKVVDTYKFDKEESAKLMEEFYSASDEAKVKRSGKKVTVTMDGKDFADSDKEVSKDDVKNLLKDMGYEVK